MTCAACGEELTEGASFCEACGAKVSAASSAPAVLSVPAGGLPAQGSPLVDELSPISRPTNRTGPAPAAPQVARTCRECGGAVGADDYCTVCGTKAPAVRDHTEENPAPWVGGVCDRGVAHTRNEDAMALWADPDPSGRAVLVVCDGVTSAEDSDVASAAATQAALGVLRPAPPVGVGGPEAADAIARQSLTAAAAAANTAVIAHTNPSSAHPASCTYAVGLVQGSTLWGAVIGDSRVYWLPDDGEGHALLGDDSMAQALIDAGTPREQAETSPQAHAITKWLGLDSPDITPRVATVVAEAPGWFLVCSDGLWNYASTPAELRGRIEATRATDPLAITRGLVEWAIAQGGRDNITAALARIGGAAAPADVAAAPADVAVGENATHRQEGA